MSTFKPLVAACVALFVHYVQTADVQYTMDLTWDIGAPDGNPRKMVLNNGGFPGPELRLDEGDNVKVGCKVCSANHFQFDRFIDYR